MDLVNELQNLRRERRSLLDRVQKLEAENAKANPNFIYGEPNRT